MDIDWQKRRFRELRYEYYSSGRFLWFNDMMAMGALLLGYGIELSLKQILIEAGCTNNSLLHSHYFQGFVDACRTRELIDSLEVSEDLVHFVSDRFHQRYPSQSEETSRRANDRGHAVSLDIGVIIAYDDFMIQLDKILVQNSNDTDLSVALLAAELVNRTSGRAFFHCNVPALKNHYEHRQYLKNKYNEARERMESDGLTPETIEYNLRLHQERLNTWDSAPESIWVYKKTQRTLVPDFETLKELNPGKEFEYPGRVYRFQKTDKDTD